MTLEPSLNGHFNKARPMVRSVIVRGFPHHNDATSRAAIHRDSLDTRAFLSRDSEAGECPASKERQLALCFVRFGNILEAAIADSLDVVRFEMYLRNFDAWPPNNPHWSERIPDPQCRPTRHATRSEPPEGSSIQMVATAISTEG